MKTALRIETRLKPDYHGHEVANLENPFAKVKLIPLSPSWPDCRFPRNALLTAFELVVCNEHCSR